MNIFINCYFFSFYFKYVVIDDENLSILLDEAVKYNKLDGWRDGGIKEKKLRIEVNNIVGDPEKTMNIMEIIKAQNEY